jgi:hypothetical protein
MTKSDPSLVSLTAHPSTPTEAVRCVAASAERVGPVSLRFVYQLEADPKRIRIPPPVSDAGRTDKLWTHTCFEAFVGLARTPQYLELNFSPSGHWAAYCFQSYREGAVPALDAAPRLTLRRDVARLVLQAEVRLSGALDVRASSQLPLRIALSTVVEDQQGGLSYWALRHPSGRPDFHHPDSFSLALEFSGNPAP